MGGVRVRDGGTERFQQDHRRGLVTISVTAKDGKDLPAQAVQSKKLKNGSIAIIVDFNDGLADEVILDTTRIQEDAQLRAEREEAS
jgi:hypothetical protein